MEKPNIGDIVYYPGAKDVINKGLVCGISEKDTKIIIYRLAPSPNTMMSAGGHMFYACDEVWGDKIFKDPNKLIEVLTERQKQQYQASLEALK